jgi:hypothetical protein
MLQRIISKKVELPVVYLVENQEDWDNVPKGIPKILADKSELKFITIFLEFQVLIRSCRKTGIPIKWEDCLKRLGYKSNLREYELVSGGTFTGSGEGAGEVVSLDTFIEDQYLVDFDRLAQLKVLPVWLEDLRASIETNIIDEVVFDPCAFNKQLGMSIGASTLKHNMKNLLILDVSGSMPRGVVKTITNLAKLMSKKFYADIMLTSGRTILIDYNDVPNADIIELARLSGGGNEGKMYRELLKVNKNYNTCISFGDDDNPGWYLGGENEIKCNYTIETLYSLHTEGDRTSNVTGYAAIFKPKTTHTVKDWISTINK